MILKASRRARSIADARELHRHLLEGPGNERIEEATGPGSVADVLEDAMLLAVGPGRAACWHVSVSPEVAVGERQWERVEAVLRGAYRLSKAAPVAVVEHSKPHRPRSMGDGVPRPAHRHFLFPTTNPSNGAACSATIRMVFAHPDCRATAACLSVRELPGERAGRTSARMRIRPPAGQGAAQRGRRSLCRRRWAARTLRVDPSLRATRRPFASAGCQRRRTARGGQKGARSVRAVDAATIAVEASYDLPLWRSKARPSGGRSSSEAFT
jgi:hypothetical protein